MSENSDQKAGIRRTAVILGLVALVFYLGFIYLGAGRS